MPKTLQVNFYTADPDLTSDLSSKIQNNTKQKFIAKCLHFQGGRCFAHGANIGPLFSKPIPCTDDMQLVVAGV